jgi:hypothetical protein
LQAYLQYAQHKPEVNSGAPLPGWQPDSYKGTFSESLFPENGPSFWPFFS